MSDTLRPKDREPRTVHSKNDLASPYKSSVLDPLSSAPFLSPLSPTEVRQIVQACDRFEAAWKQGPRPQPEDYLGALGEPLRTAMLRQLLLLDWDYRVRVGDTPRTGDYLTRFPADAAMIENVGLEMAESAGSTGEWSNNPNNRPTHFPIGHGVEPSADADERFDGSVPRYDLVCEVGRGGIGVVFRSRDRVLGRDLAVKVLRKAYRDKPDACRRFIAEARVGSQLQHPAIVPVYEMGRFADGRPYFTMKLVEGHTLAELLRGRADAGPDLPRWLGVFEQVCQAMAYAHDRGVVHRDLKPANIMVGTFGEVQVMDWGFAKVLGEGSTDSTEPGPAISPPTNGWKGVTLTGTLMGTPAYMPPEQARGDAANVDARADVFTLGAILCEILTGGPPYGDSSAPETCRQAAEGKLDDAFARLDRCGADEPLRVLAKSCMAVERDARPADAAVVAREVTEYLASAQQRLRQVQLEQTAAEARVQEAAAKGRAERRARRLTVALAAALLCGATVAVWQAARATRATTDALDAAAVATTAKNDALAAADAEKTAKEQADAKEAETQTVLGFVINRILSAARPKGQEGGLGREVTMRQALEGALPVVDKDFADQPLTEARLRLTLGDTFRYLGEFRIAADQYVRARALYTEHLGPDHIRTFESINNLALSYHNLGDKYEALRLREEVLPKMIARFGPDDPDTLSCMNNLASSYTSVGRHDEALLLREKALPLLRARLGPDNRLTLANMNNLALSYSMLDRHADALRLREELLPRMKAALPPDHPNTLTAMNNLASSYYALRRYDDALKLYEETITLKENALGPAHLETLKSRHNRAATLAALKRYDDALRFSQQTMDLWKGKYGLDHPDALLCLEDVARCLIKLDRGAEGIPILDDCLRRAAGQAIDPSFIPEVTDVRLRYFETARDANGCRETAEMWEKLQRTDAASLYNAACYRAVTTAVLRAKDTPHAAPEAAAVEADRAIAWLKQAIAAGYKDVAHMMNDKDLGALRDRADFQELLAELRKR
jgi:eukaryotic-like serine/threonine-protein kinase